MANEFKHKTVGSELTQTEFEAVGGHVLDSQATGDIIYASSATQLTRLARGSANDVLTMGGSNIPAWDSTWTPAGHLIPAADDSYDLGSASAAWQDLFLEGDITLTDAGTISTTAGALSITPASGSAIVLDTSTTLDGGVLTFTPSTDDTVVMTAATNGAFSLVTTDNAAAAANIQITADGTVDIDSAGVLTLDSGAAINIEPASGSAILLDGTISIDAGVVTGATSITSTAFVGDVTGNVSGTAATVTGGTQAAITSTANLVTVGTIGTGVWEGTDVGVAHGGTGVSTLLTNAVLTGNGTSAIQAESTLLFSSSKLIPTASAHDAAGTALTMSAGATTAGTTNNIAGGALTFQGGQGKGSGAGGDIIFQTANAGGSGSSLNSLATALTLSDDLSASFAGAVVVTGNLTVNGTTTTVDTATLSVEDPLIALATGNSGDSLDVGFYGKYVDSGTKYSGLFRDQSDSDKWKLFATTGNSHEVPTTTVNTTSGFTLGTLVASAFEGALTGNADTVTTNANLTGDVTSSGNATAIASGVVVDADVNASAAIAVSKTALTAGTNISLSTNTLNVDDAFLKNDASDTTTGTITAAGFTTGNDGVLNFSDDLPSTDHAATGVTVTITSSTTLAKGVPVYISGAGTVAAADADAASTMPAIGINTTDLTGGAGEAEILLLGIWHDETYNFTAGADVFIGLDPASSTANSDVLGITTTAPTAAGDTVQKVGVVLTADTVFVNFTGTEILLA